MGYGDYDWGLYRDYYGDPFPPFPTKHQTVNFHQGFEGMRIMMFQLNGFGCRA